MNHDETIELVCRMALEFENRGNISMVGLIRKSGYPAIHDQITENEFSEYFRNHSELIETWLAESDNKRTSSGWYIKEPGDSFTKSKQWVVGFYPNGETREFHEAAEACGFYLKMEAEEIRKIS
ncbi:hypothetical protein [Geomonas ferrireducens]|uniref:hypothetical protein n=1 Tax=Geomonas ferrireducens TaxID=2570227 RepID=UPI0010A85425|nr:hypothetical protein [Geomonas ferrireducens]